MVIIIVEGKAIEQTDRENNLFPEAITRCFKDDESNVTCLSQALTSKDTAFATDVIEKHIYENVSMIEENHLDINEQKIEYIRRVYLDDLPF